MTHGPEAERHTAPDVPGVFIPRRRGSGPPATRLVITAAAGYGKTTWARDWAAGWKLPLLWLTLTPSATDPGVLLSALSRAALSAGLPVPPDLVGLTAGVCHVDDPLAAAWLDWLADTEPFCLVVDDVHAAETSPAMTLLAAIVRHVSPAHPVALCSRHDLPADLMAAMPSDGAVQRLDEDDLRFTPAEQQALLSAVAGGGASPEVLAQCDESTHGWAAGLWLMIHSLRHDPGHASVAAAGDTDVGRLIRAVHAQQPPELQRFLLGAAFLPVVSLDACQEALAIADAAVCIAEVQRRHLFVTAVGPTAVVLHPVWREGLQSLALRVLMPAELTRLADWLARNGDVPTATAVRLAADQTVEALALLEHSVMTNLLVRAPALLGHMLAAFPPSLRPQAWWQIGQAHIERRQGRVQDAVARVNALTDHADPVVRGMAQALQVVIVMEQGRPADEACLPGILDRLPATAVHQRALVNYWLGLQHFVRMDYERAGAALSEALVAYRIVDDAYGELRTLTALGNVASNQGCLAEGEALYRQALALQDRLGLPPDALLLHNLAAYLAQAGRYQEALGLLDQAAAVAVALGPLPDAFLIHRTRATVLMYLGESAQAHQEVERALQTAQRLNDPLLLAEAGFQAGEWQCRFGQASAAVALGQQAQAALQAHGFTPRWYQQIMVAEALLSAGEPATAKAMMTRLMADRPDGAMLWWLARLQQGLAQACQATGEAAEARAHREASAALCAAHGYCLPPEGPAAAEPAASAHLTITCFGRLAIRSQGQERPVQGPKARLLLALLALAPDGVGREDLLDELFSERDISHNALAMQVNRLRRALEPLLAEWPSGGAIIAHAGRYRLNPALRLACDWHDFTEAVRQVDEVSTDEARVRLYQRLVDLYQGALLPEFAQSHRIALTRSQAQRHWQQAHTWLQHHFAAQGQPARALDLADANLALDPISEVAHRFKMVTYVRLGMHNAADRQYRMLRRVLHEQLGLRPSPATAMQARELGLGE